jgi:hypothetical protein
MNKEIKIFESDYNNDPYAPPTRNYMTADEIYETLKEMSGGEEETACYDIIPAEIWEKYQNTTYMNEELIQRNKFYYLSRADELLNQFSYDELYKIDLAIYQAGGDEFGGKEFADIIAEALTNDDMLCLLNFKHYFVKQFDGIIIDVKKRYDDIIENWSEELHELDRYSYDKLWQCLLKAVGDENITAGVPALAINAGFREFANAINKKIKGLDLRNYTAIMGIARQLCVAFDRYIVELQFTVELHNDLKRWYEMKEARLIAEYKEKEAALAAKYPQALLEENSRIMSKEKWKE